MATTRSIGFPKGYTPTVPIGRNIGFPARIKLRNVVWAAEDVVRDFEDVGDYDSDSYGAAVMAYDAAVEMLQNATSAAQWPHGYPY